MLLLFLRFGLWHRLFSILELHMADVRCVPILSPCPRALGRRVLPSLHWDRWYLLVLIIIILLNYLSSFHGDRWHFLIFILFIDLLSALHGNRGDLLVLIFVLLLLNLLPSAALADWLR
jgi:hypothetical protein